MVILPGVYIYPHDNRHPPVYSASAFRGGGTGPAGPVLAGPLFTANINIHNS